METNALLFATITYDVNLDMVMNSLADLHRHNPVVTNRIRKMVEDREGQIERAAQFLLGN